MSLTTITGAASGIRHSISDARPGLEVRGTCQVPTFRVNNQSVQMRTQNLPDIQEGDHVTLPGRDKREFFEILALRNERTGSISSLPATLNTAAGAGLVPLGLPLGF
jgi:hypothetical protein